MKHFFLAVLLICGGNLLSAQNTMLTQTVKGMVIDEQSGYILPQATIALINTNTPSTAISDSSGRFRLNNIPIGRQSFKASLVGYEEAVITNIEVTSSKEIVLEIRLKESVKKLANVVVTAGKNKTRALNDMALASARQFSVDEAVRYAGTRNDPSRMAQNFAGVSGTNDARNDIVIRGNSPSGVLWRMDGIDIPNPNHFSTLGATGGPVSMLNTNTLKNSDFLTSAFPASYGNAVAGVFDLKMRNGNAEKSEFLGQAGFNGFEFGAEGPLKKGSGASYLIDYRYSLVAAIQGLGLSVGTGSSTPYYQDLTFKFHLPTKKMGTFDWFGIGGESHITFPYDTDDNLYSTNDGTLRDRDFSSLTGVTGLTHTYFFNPQTSGKFIASISGFESKYKEMIVETGKPNYLAYDKKNVQLKYQFGYTFNKKFNAKNQLTVGLYGDLNDLSLRQDYIPDGDSVLVRFVDTKEKAWLIRTYANWGHRFNDRLSTNLGLYYQQFTLNNSNAIEPRWNLQYRLKNNQTLSFGLGMHSQLQPLEVYFYQTNSNGQTLLTNRDLDMVKSLHSVIGYDVNLTKYLRFKTEIYGQYLYDAAVEKTASSFSLLNSGTDFYFPDKTNLVNKGKGYNFGLELTLERFLHKGFYFLFTGSVFQSQYQGSDEVWRNTAFNTNYVTNLLLGKEYKINAKSSFGIDTKLALAGGQRYTPFDLAASQQAGYVKFRENEAYSLRNKVYWRWDLKFSYNRNGKHVTQKWYIDLQNLTSNENIYVRTLNPKTGVVGEINQIGFFPNINYQITF